MANHWLSISTPWHLKKILLLLPPSPLSPTRLKKLKNRCFLYNIYLLLFQLQICTRVFQTTKNPTQSLKFKKYIPVLVQKWFLEQYSLSIEMERHLWIIVKWLHRFKHLEKLTFTQIFSPELQATAVGSDAVWLKILMHRNSKSSLSSVDVFKLTHS